MKAEQLYNTIVVVGATEADTAVVYLAGTIVGVILSVLIGKLAVVFDKKWVFITFMAIAGFALVIFKFVGFHSITDQVIQFCMAHFAIIGHRRSCGRPWSGRLQSWTRAIC